MRKFVQVIIIAAVAAVAMAGWRWYAYVSNTDTPYDEVGITLNSHMPLPLRLWGCGKLRDTFENALPPYGCATDDGKQWL
ncbi:hypothetical protein [Labrys wisconsinensis]|uniref:Uncharacterized protein n=1 Tax=Labrys wisconsinensis TaxID=425677 RepID=A0ABU0J4W8_9HYPH|nr:hypothetical protein [Labrys wisconsinensis]MDQ0468601.1 hypothetical protein [Labrys wisconsinensis]